MVGIVVVSHSARLADGVAELAREMAGDVRIETAGGLAPPAPGEPAPLGTDAMRVMTAIEAAGAAHGGEGADAGSGAAGAGLGSDAAGPSADAGSGAAGAGPGGVLVLMDLGSAVLSAETAVDLLEPELAERVLLVAAPLVEGAIAAAVAAQAGQPLEQVAAEARGGLAGKQAHLGEVEDGDSLPHEGSKAPSAEAGGVQERFVVTVAQGLHARPAARVVRAVAALDARVELENATSGAGPASATSLNAIATLGVREGDELLVRATGPDAAAAVAQLRTIAGAGGAGAGGTGTGGAGAGGDDAAGARAGLRPLPPGAPSGALAGVASSPGIAIGPLQPLGADQAGEPPIAERPSGTPEQEWAALATARDAVREEIGARRAALVQALGEEEAEILDALALGLDDEVLLGPARAAIEQRAASASRAWADAVEVVAARYDSLADAYQRERAGDLRDVGRRVLRALAGRPVGGERRVAAPGQMSARLTPDAASNARTIVVARDLTPLDAAGLDRAAVAGIATALGGPTSHGAILARALDVPAVVGLGDRILELAAAASSADRPARSAAAPAASPSQPTGSAAPATDASAPEPAADAILDGDLGLLIPAPDRATRAAYERRRDASAARARQAREHAHEPAVTRDGVAIEVAANAVGAEDAHAAAACGADGVGLLRTEFAFLDRASAPSEDEQVALYSAAAQALDGRPLVIRTLDAGADKPLPYLAMAPEDNPFLGVRGIRLGLARPELLATQLRAIVRTAAAYPNVKPMFPMVAAIEELRAARELLDAAIEQTRAEPQPGFEVGIMVEVPAAALTALALAHEADFLSLGTNDLTQYVLAAERGNVALAALSDGLHPAVLRLVDEVCRAARAHGRWVGVCGELAADPVALPLLIGLGVRELSVAAPAVPAVKAAIRRLDAGEAEALARAALAAESAAAVRTLAVSAEEEAGTA